MRGASLVLTSILVSLIIVFIGYLSFEYITTVERQLSTGFDITEEHNPITQENL